MPKSLPTLASKLEKGVTKAVRDESLERPRNALSLLRFFLVGHQIDPSYFHGVLDTLVGVFPFVGEEEPLHRDIAHLL